MRELERRVQKRFLLQFPILIENSQTGTSLRSHTRDVSARGVFFYISGNGLQLSARIAFSMILPAEVTGTKDTRVICKGTIVRLEAGGPAGTGVAATIDSYDFA